MRDPEGVIFDATYDGRQQETSDDGGVKSTCNKRHETLQHSSVSLSAHAVAADVMEEGNAVNQSDDNPQVGSSSAIDDESDMEDDGGLATATGDAARIPGTKTQRNRTKRNKRRREKEKQTTTNRHLT